MISKLCMLLLSSLIFINVNANNFSGVLQGIVSDAKTKTPISGANIYISDIKVGTVSGADGKYELRNLPEGNHLLEISHVGYYTVAISVFVSPTSEINFELSEAVVENNAVVVTGVGKATQIKRMPFQVDFLRKEDIFQTTSSNIIEAISKKAGIASLSTGPAISKPFIRGLGYNRLLTINDGVRQEGQQWGDEHGIEIDDNSVQKIEILKGPASLIYGSDAMAGVINIISNVPVQANTLQANLGSEYQSNNGLRNVYGNISANKNGFNWNLYGGTKIAHDYKNKYDGYVFNSKYKTGSAGGYAGYNGAWGYSHFLFSIFNLKTGLVEGDRDEEGFFIKVVPRGDEERVKKEDFKSRDFDIPYQHIRHTKFLVDNSFKTGNSNLLLNVGWQRNQREEFGNIDNLNERALYFDLKTLTYNIKWNIAEKNGLRPSIGINGMSQTNTNRGVEQLIPDYKLNDVGLFAFLQKEFKKLTLSGGLRVDRRWVDANNLYEGPDVKNASFKKSFGNFSGSAGLTFQAAKNLNLKFNIAKAYRAPTISELASNGAHEGANRYEYGSINLKNELSTQFDIGTEIENEHFSFNIAGYYNHFNNFIFYQKLVSSNGSDSTINIDGEEIAAFKFSQRKAAITGIEAVLDVHPHALHWLHFQNSFTVISGKFSEAIEGIKNMPNIPSARLVSELRADLRSSKTGLKNSYIKLEVDNNFKQNVVFTAFNTETKTSGYTLINAAIGSEFVNKKGETLFALNIGALNIADVAYQNHLSRLKYAPENIATGRNGVFNAGRNFSFKITVPFKTKI